ncbi:PLD nuclease N-terminal domain-containing protein [Saccharopolyspora rosea]|uniref:PLD nuclease N-terminal domain-containing protein n=1 Tax=Saccharopolyspora rosea TaxID=524884 RepID=A0ABW3FRV9_9PSEU|nr:PLD nuclease N-terminal domain-containing protein [Saccharopolyspora rosea]
MSAYVTVFLVCALVAAYLVFVISALIGVVRSKLELVHKAAWIVAIFVFPFLGSLVWHFVGKKSRSALGNEQPVSPQVG